MNAKELVLLIFYVVLGGVVTSLGYQLIKQETRRWKEKKRKKGDKEKKPP